MVVAVVIMYITLSFFPISQVKKINFVSNPTGDSTLTVASSTKIRYLRK